MLSAALNAQALIDWLKNIFESDSSDVIPSCCFCSSCCMDSAILLNVEKFLKLYFYRYSYCHWCERAFTYPHVFPNLTFEHILNNIAHTIFKIFFWIYFICVLQKK